MEGGFDGCLCGAKPYGENQSEDWFCQHAPGMLDLNGFESTFLVLTRKKAPPCGDALGERGFDCLFCDAKQNGENQSEDWFCQHAPGMLD